MEPQAKPDPITEAALRSLHDIATPPPVAWWPQTWGWALVALLVVAALCLWLLARVRRYQREAYRREALRLLDEIEPKLRQPITRKQAVEDLAEILKRTALVSWPRGDVASLSGSAWVRFLDHHDEDGSAHALERLLDDLEYTPAGTEGFSSNICSDLIVAARTWIERHNVSA